MLQVIDVTHVVLGEVGLDLQVLSADGVSRTLLMAQALNAPEGAAQVAHQFGLGGGVATSGSTIGREQPAAT